MNSKITKKDVALYFANKLGRERRREIALASRNDPQVQEWFADLTPTEEELEKMPVVTVDPARPEYRAVAVEAYFSVEKQVAQEADEDDSNEIDFEPVSPTPATIPFGQFHQTANGGLRLSEVWRRAGADPTPIVPALEVPHLGRQNGILEIVYDCDSLPKGVVVVTIKRLEGTKEVELCRRTIRLKPISLQGKPAWYAEVPLKALIGEVQPGTQLDYCIDPCKDED